MIIKAKKIALIDEVVSFLDEASEFNKKTEIENNYEESFRRFIKMNYHTLSLEKTKEFIGMVNEFNLLKEEKFKIINYKPKDLLELSLIIGGNVDKLTKDQLKKIYEFCLAEGKRPQRMEKSD